MNKKVLSLILLVFVSLTSCKNEKTSNDSEKDSQEIIIDENFKVTLDVVIKKDDDFQLYYTKGESSDFSEEESIWIKVKGSDLAQKVVFTLPKDYTPTLFRLDFGLAENQEPIKLNSIDIDYMGNNFSAKGLELANYFRPIENTKIDFTTGLIDPIRVNGKRAEPVLYPHEIPMGEVISNLKK